MSDPYLPCPRPGCDGRLVSTADDAKRCPWCGFIADAPNKAGDPAITGIRFTPATEGQRERGLLGFVRCVIAGVLVLDGITLRRTLDNRLTLSFPEREDGLGRRHPVMRPVDDDARRAIEAAILGSLGWWKP